MCILPSVKFLHFVCPFRWCSHLKAGRLDGSPRSNLNTFYFFILMSIFEKKCQFGFHGFFQKMRSISLSRWLANIWMHLDIPSSSPKCVIRCAPPIMCRCSVLRANLSSFMSLRNYNLHCRIFVFLRRILVPSSELNPIGRFDGGPCSQEFPSGCLRATQFLL